MKLLAIFLMVFPLFSFALEVDEKLTVRIIRSSETRKTVIINRGTEDGLVEGDHARFLVTAGIVARGVCIKVSPTRSVWSLYRLVNADFIVNDSVMTIKITPPVKTTKDETQTLVEEDTPTRTGRGAVELGIPLADGAQDITAVDEDLSALEGPTANLVDRNREVLGLINISGLTANSSTEAGDESFNSSHSYHHIGLGGELYPRREREWYSKFSLFGSINIMRLNSQAYNGASSTNDVTEFSFGVNWHPTKLPSVTMEFIPYIHLGIHVGTVNSTFTPGTNNPGGPVFSSTGNSNGFVIGYGYKFYIARGFGARVIVDYYMRNEIYTADENLNTHTRVVGGPRFMTGLSYRF